MLGDEPEDLVHHRNLARLRPERDIRAQFDTNLLGALWVTQAALPILREQGSGHILRVSSIGGVTAFLNTGGYHAAKWALEGLSQSLAQEVAGFGIKVTLIEPTGYATDWSGSSARHAKPLPAYDGVREQAAQARARRFTAPGDPRATGEAVLRIVDAESPPLRVFLGETPLGIVTADYESRLATWREWQPVSVAAQGGGSPGQELGSARFPIRRPLKIFYSKLDRSRRRSACGAPGVRCHPGKPPPEDAVCAGQMMRLKLDRSRRRSACGAPGVRCHPGKPPPEHAVRAGQMMRPKLDRSRRRSACCALGARVSSGQATVRGRRARRADEAETRPLPAQACVRRARRAGLIRASHRQRTPCAAGR